MLWNDRVTLTFVPATGHQTVTEVTVKGGEKERVELITMIRRLFPCFVVAGAHGCEKSNEQETLKTEGLSNSKYSLTRNTMPLEKFKNDPYFLRRVAEIKKSADQTCHLTVEEMLTKGLYLIAFAHGDHFKILEER